MSTFVGGCIVGLWGTVDTDLPGAEGLVIFFALLEIGDQDAHPGSELVRVACCIFFRPTNLRIEEYLFVVTGSDKKVQQRTFTKNGLRLNKHPLLRNVHRIANMLRLVWSEPDRKALLSTHVVAFVRHWFLPEPACKLFLNYHFQVKSYREAPSTCKKRV